MHALANQCQAVSRVCRRALDVGERLGGDRAERVGGPGGEPIEGAAVDERGELAQALPAMPQRNLNRCATQLADVPGASCAAVSMIINKRKWHG